MVMQSDSVIAAPDSLPNVDRKLDRHGPDCIQHVRVPRRFTDFPAQETCPFRWPAFALFACSVTGGHGTLISCHNLLRLPVHAHLTSVDPDDAVAEAANLIELMANEDDGAAGAGHVAHFAQAFFLKIDVADGQDFIHEKDFRLEMGG